MEGLKRIFKDSLRRMGLDMKSEYPLEYQKRQDARERINEIKEDLANARIVS